MHFYGFLKKEVHIFSPIVGQCISIDQVPDPVFSEKIMGEGVGFINSGSSVYAPCEATVVLLPSSKHAVGLQSEEGIEILIHIGMDTVELNGAGFTSYVKVGDSVRAGDRLLSYDRSFMEEKGVNLITPMVITNSADGTVRIMPEIYGKVNLDSEIISVRK